MLDAYDDGELSQEEWAFLVDRLRVEKGVIEFELRRQLAMIGHRRESKKLADKQKQLGVVDAVEAYMKSNGRKANVTSLSELLRTRFKVKSTRLDSLHKAELTQLVFDFMQQQPTTGGAPASLAPAATAPAPPPADAPAPSAGAAPDLLVVAAAVAQQQQLQHVLAAFEVVKQIEQEAIAAAAAAEQQACAKESGTISEVARIEHLEADADHFEFYRPYSASVGLFAVARLFKAAPEDADEPAAAPPPPPAAAATAAAAAGEAPAAKRPRRLGAKQPGAWATAAKSVTKTRKAACGFPN